MSRKLLVMMCAVCATYSMIGASSAAAAPTLTLRTGPDPTESIATQIEASGTSTNAETTLNATVKPAGGSGCAANSQADGGERLYFGLFVEEGPFSKSVNQTFDKAGSYVVCGWLNDESQSGDPLVAHTELTFSVRAPHLALSIVAPASVRPGQTFQIVTTAQAEVARTVEEFVIPNTGRGCPANSAAATSTSGDTQIYWPARFGSSWSVEGGPFSESVNEDLRSTGQYLACAYVEYPTSQSPPEITASAVIDSSATPPPCVVPRIKAGSTLASAERQVRSAHCTVGRVRARRSRRYRRGRVLRLGARAGQRLQYHAPVEIIISSGRH
jgi:hypothetical protein